jgi:hypothetical protein
MKPMEIAISSARVPRWTATNLAAEKGLQRHFQLANILNVPHTGKEPFRQLGVGRVRRVRLRCLLRLRPSCEAFLSSL